MASMVNIDRYRAEDQPAIEALFRRVFGDEAAELLRQQWDWKYGRNPNLLDGLPLTWVARDADGIVGQFATMPVRLSIHGTEIDGAWGTDVMVAPERQRQGLGDRLLTAWDTSVGASLGLSLTDASHGLLRKLGWADMGRVPRLVKPMSMHVLRSWGDPSPRAALATALGPLTARLRPLGGDVRRVARFDEPFTRLWERVAPRFAFAVRRDAPYLNWKFVEAPHLRYESAALWRGGEVAGYVVYRHLTQEDRRATVLVDFLVDPSEPRSLAPLLRWVEREARAAGSELVRVFATHAGFREVLAAAGYHVREPVMRLVARINAVSVPSTFHESFDEWHVTRGDADADH